MSGAAGHLSDWTLIFSITLDSLGDKSETWKKERREKRRQKKRREEEKGREGKRREEKRREEKRREEKRREEEERKKKQKGNYHSFYTKCYMPNLREQIKRKRSFLAIQLGYGMTAVIKKHPKKSAVNHAVAPRKILPPQQAPQWSALVTVCGVGFQTEGYLFSSALHCPTPAPAPVHSSPRSRPHSGLLQFQTEGYVFQVLSVTPTGWGYCGDHQNSLGPM
ncbi:hypothetical protein AAY473_021199 [Plecturocebus cupreus]